MNKIKFSLLKNKFVLAGLFSGVILTALVFILIISSNNRSPDKNKLKGTISESYTPAIGDEGTVLAWGVECNYKVWYSDVIFDKDPSHNSTHCHYKGTVTRVKIVSITGGACCAGGGIAVTEILNP